MKTYADKCLEIAAKATDGPWEHHNWDVMERPHVVAHSLWNGKDHCNGHFDVPCTPENAEFIAFARTSLPVLAKRLISSIDGLDCLKTYFKEIGWENEMIYLKIRDLIEALEAMPEDKK